jgi:hypothetical protein
MAAASVETTQAAQPAALFLALLAAVSLAVLLVPSWRQRFHWGRTRDSYPVSRRGCTGIVAAFAVMAGGPAGAYAGLWSGRAGFFVLVAGFAIFIGAGLLDRPRGGAG